VERHQVEASSMITGLAYDASEELLEIEFKNGKTYRYSSVPEDVYRDFVSASSAGDFFLKNIRSRYRFHEVRGD
jgi:hypothetical protein